MSVLRRPRPDARDVLPVPGTDDLVRVRRSARARRILLRVDPAVGGAELVLPPGVPLSEGVSFVGERAGWLAARLAALPVPAPFADGAILPFRGDPHRIRHRDAGPRPVWREAGDPEGPSLNVTGRPEHLPRRLGDWLRGEARRLLRDDARVFAEALGRCVARVRIGDPRRQWGSCSGRGVLAFSWRLVLAPDPVRRYVAAHEIAHLVEMNHGARFWALNAELLGGRAAVSEARAWLRRHGQDLHRYGQPGRAA